MKIAVIGASVLLAVTLTGCPSATQTKVAQAVDNISIITVGLQKAEIASYQAGEIPAADHQFIEQQMLSLATVGKTADSCIAASGNTAGDIACINTVVTAVQNVNASGGLYLKSAQAKQIFQTAMGSIETVLVSIETVLGSQPATVPAS